MQKTFEVKQLDWRERCHAITMWAASHHPQLWPWEHNQRYFMEDKVADPNMKWDDYVLARPNGKHLTLGSLWYVIFHTTILYAFAVLIFRVLYHTRPMANWQMHSVGELGAKSYVAREKLNAAAFSAFLMDPDINNPVRHLLVWGFIAVDSS